MDSKGVAAAPVALSSAASEEDRNEAKNMISPMSTSCAPSNRKRPFDALDGSGRENNTAAAACSTTDTNEPSSSIEALLKDMQHKMNCMQTKFEERMDEMQTEIDTTRGENAELETKCYGLESKMEDITSLKDEQNEGSFDNNERMHDMQTEIDTLRDENNELKIQLKDLDIKAEEQSEELKTKCHELEIKVKDLTLKNEYNEWSYTAEDIPASYWIERGFVEEEYADRMIEFLGKMKEYAHQLRRGESPKKINLVFTNDHMLHDDILLPHWKEFTDALVQYQKYNHREDYGIDILRIGNVQLQQEVLDMLSPALQTLDIKSLVLGGNIGSDLVSFMADIIQHNSYIQGIVWDNQIESVDDMKKLCKAIKKSTSFTSLALINCFDGNNLQMMQTILDASHQLGKLVLNNNGIGTVGTNLIADFLTSNPPLKRLYLKNNDLNDTDAALLANALQSNTSLERIDLEGNNDITAIGRQALLKSVFNVSSLNACVASNHMCWIYGLNPNISKINNYSQSSTNRENKIFTMLSATDEGFFNMNCLGDVSYKLIPRVMRLAQKFTEATPDLSEIYFEQTGQRSADWDKLDEDTVPITSIFELLRGWAVPSLSD